MQEICRTSRAINHPVQEISGTIVHESKSGAGNFPHIDPITLDYCYVCISSVGNVFSTCAGIYCHTCMFACH